MKKNVILSTYCWIISSVSVTLMCGVFLYCLRQPDNTAAVVALGSAIVALLLATLFFMPLSLSVDDRYLHINRSLRIKSIALTDIASVEHCPPTMGATGICGSGGWFGYYGWFKERDLGRYFAYYGKASDCIR